MSNVIPPLLSNTPPPIIDPLDDDEDDEFGHFTSAIDLSYNCEVLSMPSSPSHAPTSDDKLDINSNTDAFFDKDYQDKRKRCDTSLPAAAAPTSETTVNSSDPVDSRAKPDGTDEVPEHVECRTNVPSARSDRADRKTKPPDLEEPPAFALDQSDDDDDDDLNPPCDSLHLSECGRESPPGDAPESTDNRVIFLNSDDASVTEISSKGEEAESNSADVHTDNETESRMSSLQTEDTPQLEEISEFADFQASPVVNNEPDDVVSSSWHAESGPETCDFAQFQASSGDDVRRQEESPPQFADFSSFRTEGDFDNFCDFQDAEPPSSRPFDGDDDEFGDYTQNQAADDFVVPTNVLKNAEKIIADMFPVSPQEGGDPLPEHAGFVRNPVFQEIKDITETRALTYQWVKSSCQDNLLRALNIDARNILYGPGWNPSMPKFAANLSFAPLQPVKSDVLPPTPSGTSQDSPTPSGIQPDIPSAQFDWTGSGLTNPLDSLQKDGKENLSPKNLHVRTPTCSQGDNDSVNSLQFATDAVQDGDEVKAKGPTEKAPLGNGEDDFGDFASYQSPRKTTETESAEPGWLKPTILTPDLPRKTQDLPRQAAEGRDDFTEFQASLPPPSGNPEGVFPPAIILEPLRPTVLQEPLQINWPAPGITDDDIRHIELTYQAPKLPPKDVGKIKPETTSSNNVNDDDDWSDFVCNPVSTTSRLGLHRPMERCATPELQLSVPQLSHLQPPKAPIPVITPNGLIQTKIPSNVPGMNASGFQPSYPLLQANAHFQPSIISNQYQNHMNGPVFSRVPKNGYAPPVQTNSKKEGGDDDDDWTDFISSPPPQNVRLQNGVARNSDWNRVLTPNIITNPVHFDLYRNYPTQGGGKKTAAKPKQIPSISALPDLDFVAPKGRTFAKK